MGFSTRQQSSTEQSPEESLRDAIVLPAHLEIIARFPLPLEERFDLAFLHATYHPLQALRGRDTAVVDIFEEQLHDYRVGRLNYLLKTFFDNAKQQDRTLWAPLSAEAICALKDRRLFIDREYQGRLLSEYAQLSGSGILDRLCE